MHQVSASPPLSGLSVVPDAEVSEKAVRRRFYGRIQASPRIPILPNNMFTPDPVSESSIEPGSANECRTYGVTKIPFMRGQNLPSRGSTKIVAVAPVDTAVRAVARP